MTPTKLAKIAGLLLLIGPLVDLLVSISRPGAFPGEATEGVQGTTEGVQGAMQAGVHTAALNTDLVQLLVDIGFVASLALLIGFGAFSRLMGDTDGRGHLRKAGLLFLTVSLAVRTAGFAMGYLLATVLRFVPFEALQEGPALDTAVMFLVMEGALSTFAIILAVVGTAFFAISVLNANLLGSGRLLTGLMGVAPVAVSPLLFFLAPFFGDGIFVTYTVANIIALVQVVWIILFGAALIRKSDSFTAMGA